MPQIKNSITKHINIQNSVFNLNSGEVINGNFNNAITPPVIINIINNTINNGKLSGSYLTSMYNFPRFYK